MNDDKKTLAKNMLKNIVASIKQDSKFLKDVVKDHTGLKKIEAQITDSQYELDQVKAKVTVLLQKELQSTRKLKILRYRMVEEESLVMTAMNDGDEQKAYSMATDLAATEHEYQNQLQLDESFKMNLDSLQSEMEYAERYQKELVRQLSMADTTKRIQEATDVIVKSLNQIDNKHISAKASLQRIRERQQKRDNDHYKTNRLSNDLQEKSAIETNEGVLKKLESAEDVLKRLQDKKSQP